ncbi:MAG: FG-GAP repeat domain-containing protein [Myxococcota bacterium]
MTRADRIHAHRSSRREGRSRRGTHAVLGLVLAGLAAHLVGCGEGRQEGGAPPKDPAASSKTSGAPATPDSLDQALVLGLAQFVTNETEDGRKIPTPGAARMEFLVRRDGRWEVEALEDPASNVIHKAMAMTGPDGEPALLSAGGSAALLKLWTFEDGEAKAETLWEKDFGGKFSRMRDVEIADLYGDGSEAIAVATHDQGVVAVVRRQGDAWSVEEIDQEADTFVHEIEIGDLDGDGVLEVYSTPSEPNRLDGSVQPGKVTRYVPARGEGRVVAADLKDRHAKEIFVGDVDGNGRDELYVVVEGHAKAGGRELEHGIEVLRYEAETPADSGVVIAEVWDRLARFLTMGDVDGDGRSELVLAAFSSGLWLLQPGDDPQQPWTVTSIDRDSGGFEHAALLTDLDGDGRDELYVASDKHKQVRRYVWDGKKMAREVIYRRPDDRAIFTWNIMPVPLSLVP